MQRHIVHVLAASAALAVHPLLAAAQLVNPVLVLNKTETVGGDPAGSAALAAHGYKPANNSDPLNPTPESYYVTGFNSTYQDIRRIDIAADGTKTVTRQLVTNTPWTRFLKAGDLDRGGGAPTPGSLILNKTAIPGSAIGAYGAAFISDNGGLVTDGSTNRYDLTQRIYRYNLGTDTNADASDEFTSLVTLAQMRADLGYTTTNPSSNLSRQVALSSDSSTVYFVDSSTVATGFGGLWTVPALGGTVHRVVADTMNIEPAVASVGGHDRIYFNGSTTSPGGTNVGGLDYLDTTDNTRKVGLAATTLAAFAEMTVANLQTQSATSDADGNIYFSLNNSATPERRGVYELDTQGRLIKIVSYVERNAVVAAALPGQTAIGSTLRLQSHLGTYTGPNGAFNLTELTYNESSAAVSSVAGIYVFKPGDFDHDNAYTAADGALFASKLTPLSTTTTVPVADARFDLNGNNIVNYRDVKVLQSFIGFKEGDTNFDLTVNFDDLIVLAQHYGQLSGQTWATGDFDGTDGVNFDDLIKLAQNYNTTVNPSALIAATSASFASDWALARSLVPEPTTITVLSAVTIGFAARRRPRVLLQA